jgi:putative ABC transport system ATP-binding protein
MNRTDPSTALIALDGITKRYHSAAGTIVALADVSLRIFDNDYVAITGPSGSGKSTLMQIVACLDQPTTGSYRLQGCDLRDLGERRLAEIRNRTFGFIFQSFNLLPRATVLRNVIQPLCYRDVSLAERVERGLAALDRVGLADRANHRPHQLSGGEQQRVAIARAVCAEPAVLIGDEPTGNLDAKSADVVMNLLDELHAAGQTILIVTHAESVAARCSSRIALEYGRVHSIQSPAREVA